MADAAATAKKAAADLAKAGVSLWLLSHVPPEAIVAPFAAMGAAQLAEEDAVMTYTALAAPFALAQCLIRHGSTAEETFKARDHAESVSGGVHVSLGPPIG
ncbi:MAG TPA: hypothetical protein VKA30_02250 [Actinomycetota bacterium]|nr:hypothetical protein [Actinomycetota bacterium]